jgi:hypothetical protein
MGLGSNHYDQSAADNNSLVRDIWVKWYLYARENNLILGSKVRRLEKEYLRDGRTYTIPGIGNVVASPKVAGSPVSFIRPSETSYTVTVDQHYEVSFMFEDLAMIQSYYDLKGIYEEKQGYALAKEIDDDLALLYASFSTTDVGTAATSITKPVMLAAQRTLNSLNVPKGERQFAFHEDNYDDLASLSSIMYASNVGNVNQPGRQVKGMENPSEGLFFTFYGDPVYLSTNIAQTTATSANHNMLFHKEAMVLAVQMDPTKVEGYHKDYLGEQSTMHELWGTNILRADHGVEILT